MGPVHLQWHLALQVMASFLPQQTLYKNFPDLEIGKYDDTQSQIKRLLL